MRACLAFALLTISCRPPAPAPAIDPRLVARVAEDASALVGFDLAALRTSPLYAGLPRAPHEARYLLIALRGPEVVTATLGVDGTVAGGTQTARHARSPLLADAEPLAARNPMWAVIRGGTALPLQGNLANLNNLLRQVELVTLTGQLGDRVTVELVASCPTPEEARQFEGSFRAVLLLSKMAGLVRLQREDRRVTATLTVPEELVAPLLR